MPLVVRVPGVSPAGATSDGLVETIDLFPTLAELCGLDAPAHLQGQSYTSLIRKPDTPGRPSAYTVVSRGTQLGRSIRTKRWRYAEWGEAKAAELYNLQKDPREYTNLAKSPKHLDVVKRMESRLVERQAQAEAARKSPK